VRNRLAAVAIAAAMLAVAPGIAAADVSVHYPAPRLTSLPVIFLIHGGGWETETTSQTKPWVEMLNREGYPVVNAAYRLSCGHAGCPRADKLILDLTRKLRWTRHHMAAMHTTSTTIIAVGFSAGGQLAALLTARGITDAAVGFSAQTTFSVRAISRPLWDYAEQLVGCEYSACPAKWRAVSASHYATTRPMYLAYGQHEKMVSPTTQVAPMRRADPEARIVLVPGAEHSDADLENGWERHLLGKGIAYVNRQLAGRGGEAGVPANAGAHEHPRADRAA
jgi:acetyl esterase/lipase